MVWMMARILVRMKIRIVWMMVRMMMISIKSVLEDN